MFTAFEFQETKNGKCSLTLPLYSITLKEIEYAESMVPDALV